MGLKTVRLPNGQSRRAGLLTPRRLVIAVLLLFLTTISFTVYPRHLFGQSDTLIYVPMLKHLQNSSLYQRDAILHDYSISLTLYDEIALGLQHLTHLDLQTVLQSLQFITRFLGLCGLYLLARACSLPTFGALLVTATLALGARVHGPSLNTLELEPVPRSFAMPLIYLALGLVARRRWWASGCCAALALWFQPPATYPFFLVAAAWWLRCLPRRDGSGRSAAVLFVPAIAAAIVLLLFSRQSAGGALPPLFTRLGDWQNHLQTIRLSQNRPSLWDARTPAHYILLATVMAAAYWRLVWGFRVPLAALLRFFLTGLPLVGAVSVPFTYVLLEKMHWAFLSQFEPMRAVLYFPLFAMLLAAAAGCHAARTQRLIEAAAWWSGAFAIAFPILLPPRTPFQMRLMLIACGCALLFTALSSLWEACGRSRWKPLLALSTCAALMVPPMLFARQSRRPTRESPGTLQLAAWANSATARNALFAFPGAGRSAAPSVFRLMASRAVYADWKAGQTCLSEAVARRWWQRWSFDNDVPFSAKRLTEYRARKIDYVAVPRALAMPVKPVYKNEEFAVYKTS